MRFLKKLLISLYVFLGCFTVACFIAWCVTGSEPQALIAGVFAGVGLESVAGVFIKRSDSSDTAAHAEADAEETADDDMGRDGRAE